MTATDKTTKNHSSHSKHKEPWNTKVSASVSAVLFQNSPIYIYKYDLIIITIFMAYDEYTNEFVTSCIKCSLLASAIHSYIINMHSNE